MNSSISVPAHFKVGVHGMHCAACVSRVEHVLNDAGVSQASVNLALEQADLHFDADHTTLAGIETALGDAGFQLASDTLRLRVLGMHCAACARAVEQAVAALSGVLEVSVNPATELARVRIAAGSLTRGELIRCIEGAGYGVDTTPGETEQDETSGAREQARLRRDLLLLGFAALVAVPFLVQMLGMFAGAGWHMPPLVEWLLATPVQFLVGARFHAGAWRALRARAPDMDVLVSMGTFAAYLYSLVVWMQRGEAAAGSLYFEAAVLVITLVLAGKMLEGRARRGTAAAIRQLMSLRPATARVLRDGEVQELPVERVQVGDRVLIRPGETIPVDARVDRGESEVDEALLTGESMPVARRVGDPVIAGAINGTGSLEAVVQRVGADTTLARIIALVENAQAAKAPVQRLVDRVSRVFVPVVLVIAALTACAWLLFGPGVEQALVAAVSVLVIACPCALGLATPTAIVAGTGAAARAGILIRDAEALERASQVQVVAFDKTGTLTHGQPAVSRVQMLNGSLYEADLMALVASAQRDSEHPLARAFVGYARDRGLRTGAPEDFDARPGEGIEAVVSGRRLAIGNRALMQRVGVTLEEHAPALSELEAAGQTLVLVAVDGALEAAVGVEDPLRDSARAAVQALKRRRVHTLMLSGDSDAVAARVARALELDDVRAGMKPGDKSAEIQALRARGKVVAMVGDGVNDAPALAAADVGIAMGSGSDVAMESASITLMRNDPRLVAAAMSVSSATLAKIRQNLFWAFFYNLVCIPVAALGLLNPVWAGAAMALSSVSVVSNSLLLTRWRER